MGNSNHTKWYNKSKRKILILSLDEECLESKNVIYIELSNVLVGKKIKVPIQTGFVNNNIKSNNLKIRLWVFIVPYLVS